MRPRYKHGIDVGRYLHFRVMSRIEPCACRIGRLNFGNNLSISSGGNDNLVWGFGEATLGVQFEISCYSRLEGVPREIAR